VKVTARQLREIIKEEADRFLHENEDREEALVAKVKKMTFREMMDAYPGISVTAKVGDTVITLPPMHVFITSLGYKENDVIGDMIKRDGAGALTVGLTSMMDEMLKMEPATSTVKKMASEEEVETETETETETQ